jgi:hypothetical protein
VIGFPFSPWWMRRGFLLEVLDLCTTSIYHEIVDFLHIVFELKGMKLLLGFFLEERTLTISNFPKGIIFDKRLIIPCCIPN